MGHYTCRKCGKGLRRPDLQELRQGYAICWNCGADWRYAICWNCGADWNDIDQIKSLFDLIEDLQEQIKEIKNENEKNR